MSTMRNPVNRPSLSGRRSGTGRRLLPVLLAGAFATLLPLQLVAQTNPLWHEQKIKNYLLHMTRPEVDDLLTRTDMVLIPVPSLEQHGRHLPIGTDYLLGIERAKLIAQQTDVLVAPVLMAGIAPYHMGYAGTLTISFDTMQKVYFEVVQGLIQHGFKRILIMNSHNGNAAVSRYLVDRINHETSAYAVELGEASAPFMPKATPPAAPPTTLDGHAGVGETSTGLYLFPNLVDMSKAVTPTMTLPEQVQKLIPLILAGDATAQRLYSLMTMKARETGKRTSAREMSNTGGSGTRDPREASVDQGRRDTEASIKAAVQFIERWKQLQPMMR